VFLITDVIVLTKQNFRCLVHVINLTIVDFMSILTNIGGIQTAAALWEFDPSEVENRVLGGSLDVICAIHTLAIKVNHIQAYIFTF
jgi:hypothetical protein